MGFGIWSMHYMGMLAFRLPIPVQYDWPTVVLSLIAAIVASAIALVVVSSDGIRLSSFSAALSAYMDRRSGAQPTFREPDLRRCAPLCCGHIMQCNMLGVRPLSTGRGPRACVQTHRSLRHCRRTGLARRSSRAGRRLRVSARSGSIEPQQGWWHAAWHKKANQGNSLRQCGYRHGNRWLGGALRASYLTGGFKRPSHGVAQVCICHRQIAGARFRGFD